MINIKWSKEQDMAINTRGVNLLVSAAAGSGKTAVLVERIINNVLYHNIDIDKLLVVTFTRAAASEMKERIAHALAKRAKDKEIDHFWRERAKEQLPRLHKSSIMTLDSFCQMLVRQNFSLVDVDPKFRIATEQEILMLEQDVLENILEEEYQIGDRAFFDLLSAYGTDKDDANIYDIVFRLYKFSESAIEPKAWIKSLAYPFARVLEEDAQAYLTHSKWLQVIKSLLKLSRNSWIKTLERLLLEAEAIGALRHKDFLQAELQMLILRTKILSEDGVGFDWDKVSTDMAQIKFSKWIVAKKDEPNEEMAKLKEERDKLKKEIGYVVQHFVIDKKPIPAQKIIDDLRAVSQEVSKITDITLRFIELFEKEKREKLFVTFSDIKHFALSILHEENDVYKPSSVAEALQSTYEEVMIDEYQDTNEVDEKILMLLTRKDKPNFFAVGDVKQSIYRFRLANPNLFLEKYKHYPKRNDAKRIDLATNFRSREKILEGINFIFSQLMQKETMELSYEKESALYHGIEYPEKEEGKVFTGSIDLDIIDDVKSSTEEEKEIDDTAKITGEEKVKLEGIELEGEYIAIKLQDIKNSGIFVYDKDLPSSAPYRPLMWRDIVILLRATNSCQAEIIAERLKIHDIPAYSAGGEGYFKTPEVKLIIALLTIIDNSLQDIALASVLHSPIVEISSEELAAIELLNRKKSAEKDYYLYETLEMVNSPDEEIENLSKDEALNLKNKVNKFLSQMSHWQKQARILSVSELIFELYQETGYYDYVGGLIRGVERQANLRMLIDRAKEYEETSYRSLFRFLRFIEKIKALDNDLSVARTLGENEDVVRIMTIHKSKGLEFPVVVVADLGKNFRKNNDLFPLHRDLGIGISRNELDFGVRYPTISKWAVSKILEQEDLAEELRIFYVALTRAREKLILVGRTDIRKWAQDATKYLNERQLPSYAPLFAKNYLEWVGMCLARHVQGTKIRNLGEARTVPSFLDDLPFAKTSSFNIQKISREDITFVPQKITSLDVNLEKIRKQETLTTNDIQGESYIPVASILDWTYPYSYLQKIPTKLTVSEVKRRFQEQNEEDKVYMKQPQVNIFRRPFFIREKKGVTSTEYGTLIHTAFQHLQLQEELTMENISRQLDDMVTKEILEKEKRGVIKEKIIYKFFKTPLGKRMQKAPKIWRELPFTRLIPASILEKSMLQKEKSSTKKAEILIQGIIDVVFEDDAGLVLLDYKTDRNISLNEALARYQIQMELYADAVENMLQKEIAETYLVLLNSEKNILVERKKFF